MSPTTTIVDVNSLVAKLQQMQHALGDAGDVPLTSNAQKAYELRKRKLARAISGLRMTPSDLAKLGTRLAECEEQREVVLELEASLRQDIADAPDWRTILDGRERNKEIDRQQELKKRLQLLLAGGLLRAPGVVYEPVSYLDSQIAELRTRRDRVQQALDGHVMDAEALINGSGTQ